MHTDGWKKTDRLLHIMKLFQQPGRRWRTKEIASLLGINEDTAGKYLNELQWSGLLPITKDGPVWFLPEGAVIPRLKLSLSYPEAVALYLAGRLLAQTQDEQNWHVSMALKKLVETLPPALKEQQEALLGLLIFEDDRRPDTSQVFQVLASGWVMQRRVRLYYAPPRKRSFECLFDPYVLEPSAIGRTIYALGYSSAGNAVRTYKLERIQRAELTKEDFKVQADFNAPEKLQQAWMIMYGDETPVKVRLHFSADVTQRVRETRWHPTQEITLTRDGCEWTALIGDTLDIEPWIRGWGCDCVVLEPPELRESMLVHARRTAKNYDLTVSEGHHPDALDRNLFRKKE